MLSILLLTLWSLGLGAKKRGDFRRTCVKWFLAAKELDVPVHASNGGQKTLQLNGLTLNDNLLILLCVYSYLLICVGIFTFWNQFLFTQTTECQNEYTCFASNGSSLSIDDCDNLSEDLSVVCYRWSLNYAGASGSTFGIIALMNTLIKGIMLLMRLSTKVSCASTNKQNNSLTEEVISKLCSICCFTCIMIGLVTVIVVATSYQPFRNALFLNGFILDVGAVLQFLLIVVTSFVASLIIPLNIICTQDH